jgi:energy-coupling factor transporter ATP-binding protein EcfA2/uncharacterized membrane protein
MEAFTIKNLSFTYPGRIEPALSNISVSIEEGSFVVVIGGSGSGKTTLLRNLKGPLTPFGEKEGDVWFFRKKLVELTEEEQARRIGYVFQNPDHQIVTDKVWHELAFGLESLGMDQETIRLRVTEMASFFGIQDWFYKKVAELSGGQKQILNLASVMVLQPDVLLLDEPTSQLDPIAAGEFLSMVEKINREIGTTVIISEHRLDEVLAVADRVWVLEQGALFSQDTPENTGAILAAGNHPMSRAMPAPLKIYGELYEEGFRQELSCPVTVRDGRKWLSEVFQEKTPEPGELPLPEPYRFSGREPALSMKEVWFRYGKEEKDVIRDFSLQVYPGELFCLVGGNGTGKTTALRLMAALQKPYRGKITHDGKVALLPQNPQALFVKSTVEEDLEEVFSRWKKEGKTDLENTKGQIREVAKKMGLLSLLTAHPYDLSGGEQQRLALAKLLLTQPDILLLDEPTKGLDRFFQDRLAQILKELVAQGITIIMVSHDIEFCGRYGDRCAMMFQGNLTTSGPPRTFFSGNSFYTTAANRMSRHLLHRAVTPEEVVGLIRENFGLKKPECFFDEEDGSGIRDQNNWPKDEPESGVGSRTDPEPTPKVGADPRPLSFQVKLWMGCSLALIPLTLWLGTFWLDDRKYYAMSFLLVTYTLIPFFAVFEGRKPQAREIMVIAVLITLGVLGRAAFFMVPQFKPVLALVILAGLTLGSPAGFMTGAMTAFVSNFFFGQGPWTPWQMAALGLVGFLAGRLAEKKVLTGNRRGVIVFGALASFFLYGLVVDLWTLLALNPGGSFWQWALTVYGLALPFNLLNTGATVIFLWFLTKPVVEKIQRIKKKYGLVYSGA